MKRTATVLLILASCVATGVAQTGAWKADKNHSYVAFTVKHLVISEVTGKFKDFDISLTSSKEDFTDAVIEASIKVKSIDTGVEARDNHLRTDDFFNAEKFPEITFKSTSIEKVGDNLYKITGNLTIRDVTKKVTFDAVDNGTIKMGNNIRSAWKASLSINRFDYGVKWNRTLEMGGLVAGDVVNITINLEIMK